MSKRSVAIIGKGPSVLLGNSSIYNEFDEIALINWPIMDHKYLPQRCDSMFTHYFGVQEIYEPRKKMLVTSKPWSNNNIIKYNVKNIYCTVPNDENYIKKFIPDNFYNIKIHKHLRHINNIMKFDNNSGMFALTYYCEQPDVEKIFFIGFDAYTGKTPKDNYYFTPPSKITGQYSTINNDCHNRKSTFDYMQNIGKKYSNIDFYYISKLNFKEYDNFKKYKIS